MASPPHTGLSKHVYDADINVPAPSRPRTWARSAEMGELLSLIATGRTLAHRRPPPHVEVTKPWESMPHTYPTRRGPRLQNGDRRDKGRRPDAQGDSAAPNCDNDKKACSLVPGP